jgi:hypothetical protein
MATKSVIEIELIDEQFKAFSAQLKAMQAIIAKMPEQWKAITKEVTEEQKAETKAANEAEKARKKRLQEEKDFNKVIEDRKKAFMDAAYFTGNLAKNLASGALSIAKWTAFAAIGGGFGLGGLASNASDYRRRAQGLGTTTGDLRAAETNLGRYIDVNSVLANITSLQHDITEQYKLTRLGGGKGDSVQQLQTVMTKALQDFNAHGKDLNYARAVGLTDIFSPEDLIRLSSLSAKELEKTWEQLAKDREALKLSDQTSRLWQDFWVQLKKAGNELEVSFIKNLKDLIPTLIELSKVITTAITNLLSSEKFKEAVKSFAAYISDPQFIDKVKYFFDALGQLGEGMIYVLRKIGALPEDKNADLAHDKRVQFEFAKKDYDKMTETQKKWFHDPAKDIKLLDLEEKYKLPVGTLDALWMQESSRGKNKSKSLKGAEGDFQFMPETQKEYGITDPQDFDQEAEAAAKKIKGLLKRYANDPEKGEKAFAAYNWGEGNLDKEIAKYKDDWKAHLPKQTADYIYDQRQTIIRIDNFTDTNVTIKTLTAK